MTPERARIYTKRRIENYLQHNDLTRALACMAAEADELLFWLTFYRKGQKWVAIEGGKSDVDRIAVGPRAVRAAGDV